MDTDKVSKIKPGVIVSLKTTVSGGVNYIRRDIENKVDENGTARGKWLTEKTITDIEEHERAVKVRGKAVAEVRSVCCATNFGLLASEDRLEELDLAIVRARALADEFNATSKYSRIGVYVLKGRVASTDDEAVRSISEEVRSLLNSMEEGIAKADAKMIRDAASKAQQLSSMLAEEQVKQVSKAVLEAREAAREIVRRVEKRGEDAAKVLASITTRSIVNARMSFIDTDDEVEVPGTPMPQVNVQRFNIIEDDAETALKNKIAALEATLEEVKELE